jgi:hypothetical protein
VFLSIFTSALSSPYSYSLRDLQSRDPLVARNESQPKVRCAGLWRDKYARRDSYEPSIDSLCDENDGGSPQIYLNAVYFAGELREIKFSMNGAGNYTGASCKSNFRMILDQCDNEPENTNHMNWKAGGQVDVEGISYNMMASAPRLPAVSEPEGGCYYNDTEHILVWGRGWNGYYLDSKIDEAFPGAATFEPQLMENPISKLGTTREFEWSFHVDGIKEGVSKLEQVINTEVAWNETRLSCLPANGTIESLKM